MSRRVPVARKSRHPEPRAYSGKARPRSVRGRSYGPDMAGVLPSPNPVYRGPLKFMDGAPTPHELLFMGALLLVGLLLLLLAWSLIRSYVRGRWDGWMDPSPVQPLWALLAAAAGIASLVVLWLKLEHIAARTGVTVIVLGALLAAETRGGSRSRRR